MPLQQIETKYRNWWSKLLFQKKFEEQFYIASPPSFLERFILGSVERLFIDDSYKDIEIEKPIFIVGLPRSGTTLLYNLVAFHEYGAYVTNSMNNVPNHIRGIEWLRKNLKLNVSGERFFKDSVETNLGSPSEPIMLWGKWFERDVDSLYWEPLSAKKLGTKHIEIIKNDIRKIISTFGKTPTRFVCKYPVMQPDLVVLQEIFPDAKFIHIVRDPRAVANSLIKLHKLSNEQLQKINHPLLKSIVPYPRVKNLQHWLEKYGPDNLICTSHIWNDSIELVHQQSCELKNFYEIRYEDLLTSPENVMQSLFQFCDLPYPSVQNLKYQKEFKKIGQIFHKNNYKGFDLITRICNPLMEHFKYV
ncbi:MAG: sulfotransferase [Bdellovibrionales bacterium]|nr:sulfotransferase [Bdellovibrionales bacterium]